MNIHAFIFRFFLAQRFADTMRENFQKLKTLIKRKLHDLLTQFLNRHGSIPLIAFPVL